jgi:hypothetical protein
MRSLQLLAAMACLAVLNGCSAEPEGPASISPQQATNEFEARAAALDLPPGTEWPANPIGDSAPDGAGVVYQPGYGTAHADRLWFCAWEERALEAKGRKRVAAIQRLTEYKTSYAYRSADAPETIEATDAMISRAQLGDLGALQEDYELNCRLMLESGS